MNKAKRLEVIVAAVVVAAVLLLLLLSSARAATRFEKSKGKAIIVIRDCGKEICADPMMTPLIVLTVKSGQRPAPGQVLKCPEDEDGDLDCPDGLKLHISGVALVVEKE